MTTTPLGVLAASIAFLLGCPLAVAAPSDWTSECTQMSTPQKGAYCIHRHATSNGDDVLFYFAGRGTGEMKWFEEYPEILQYWRDSGARTPTVVTIAFDTFVGWWLLTEKKPDGNPGLYPFVADQLMPEIERRIGGVRGRRLLMGRSMGGFNALQLLFRKPRDYERVALLCPAILSISPFAKADENFAYMKRTGADIFSLLVLQFFHRTSFKDEAAWRASSPLLQAPNYLGPDTPPIHVSCGTDDHYGFQEGAEQFADLARGISTREVIWQPLRGDHCTFDSETIARYFTE